MPSSYSLRFRLNYQAPGDNLNTWGLTLNNGVFQLIEDAMARRVAFTLSGAKTLTTANGADDEARCAFLDVTSGVGGTVTIPAVEKLYVVRNGASGDVTVTTGSGASAAVRPGEVGWVACDAANVRRVQLTDMLGARLTGLGAPLAGTDAATKAYADALAFNEVNLPGQGPGTVGKLIRSDGTTAAWEGIVVADVAGAAPVVAPSFTGGVSVAGGVTQAGSAKGLPQAVPALDIDLAAADYFTKAISANSAFTFSNATASRGQAFTLELTITGAAVPSWPASVDHPGGVNPSAALGNGRHSLGFITYNGGTDWIMVVIARAVA